MKQYRPSLFEQTKTPFSRTQYMSPQSTKCNTIEGSSSKSSFDQFLIKQQSTMDDYTRERNEIFSAIIPRIDRLRQKEEHLNSIMTEASCYYEEYKKKNSHLEEESKELIRISNHENNIKMDIEEDSPRLIVEADNIGSG